MDKAQDLQQPERREFLTTASGLGGALAVGAAGLAGMTLGPTATAGSTMVSSHGTGPGLKGPYLDLSTGRGNQLAYAVNYLCLKHQRGKKRSLSGSKPSACDTS